MVYVFRSPGVCLGRGNIRVGIFCFQILGSVLKVGSVLSGDRPEAKKEEIKERGDFSAP